MDRRRIDTGESRGGDGPAARRDRGRVVTHVVGIGLLIGLGFGLSIAADEPRSPIPAFERDRRVYAVDVPDQYGPIRDEIARLEARSPQTYYVVVARTTGPGQAATRTYLDDLISTWTIQAKAQKAKFDTRRAVFIVLVLEKRQIIVLGGEELQEQFGFRDPYIERDLLQPHFYAYARSGDYVRGLQMLLGQIDRWIGDRDRSFQARQAETTAREARLKGEATSTIGQVETALGEVRRELDERKAGGLAIERYEESYRRASDDLQTARRRLDASASEALLLAQQAQRALRGIDDRLAQAASRQADLDAGLRRAHTSAGAVLAAIEQAERAGLPASAVQAQLDAINTQIEQADRTLKADPEAAETLLPRIESELSDALEHAQSLPKLRQRARDWVTHIQPIEKTSSSQVESAKRAGVFTERLASDWRTAIGTLTSARASVGQDDRAAVRAFGEAEKALRRVADDARSRVDRHQFETRTLPLTLLSILAVVALAILGLLWYRKHHVSGQLDKQFEDYRSRAVALMDQLDALRQRHKALPVTNPDYTQPISGATATLYGAVETDLNELWNQWLAVMETWDRAEALRRTGSGLAVARVEEARSLLEKQGNFDELIRRCESCRDRLDQLEQAHQQARDALGAARRRSGEVRSSLQEVAEAGLPTEVVGHDIDGVDALFAQAEGLIEADPIGALEAIERSKEALDAIAGRIAEVLARLGDVRAVRSAADEQAARAARLRSEGMLLNEPEADPDPRLKSAGAGCDTAMNALHQEDPRAAVPAIEEAQAAVAAARTGVDAAIQARDRYRAEIPARRQASTALVQRIERAAPLLDAMRRGHAPASWADVADDLDQARAHRQSSDAKLAEADAEAAPSRQYFMRAAAVLDQASHEQTRTGQLLDALTKKHALLDDLARRGPDAIRALDDQLARVAAFFAENRAAIGAESRRMLERATDACRALGPRAAPSALSAPNWPEIYRQIEAAGQGIALTSKQGQDDVEKARQVAQRRESVRQMAERIGRLLDSESRDRPPANQRYRDAAAALADFDRAADDSSLNWSHRLARLQEIETDLDRAEALFRQDLSLAGGAEAEINDAERAIRQTRAFYEAGVTVETREAQAALTQARAALAPQSYEQAIELAQRARISAQNARQAAVLEARRRRSRNAGVTVLQGNDASVLIAVAQAAARAAAGWANSQGGVSRPAPPPTSKPPTGQQGGWTSGGAGGGWTSGADQGSW